jgi:hypothetical protein
MQGAAGPFMGGRRNAALEAKIAPVPAGNEHPRTSRMAHGRVAGLGGWPRVAVGAASARRRGQSGHVHEPQTPAEMSAWRRYFDLGADDSSASWCEQMARRLGLESTIRPTDPSEKKMVPDASSDGRVSYGRTRSQCGAPRSAAACAIWSTRCVSRLIRTTTAASQLWMHRRCPIDRRGRCLKLGSRHGQISLLVPKNRLRISHEFVCRKTAVRCSGAGQSGGVAGLEKNT